MNPLLCLALAGTACGTDLPVATPAEFRTALGLGDPGERIGLAPGTYPGNFYARRLHGTAAAPIVIAGANPASPPVFTPTGTALQLSEVSHLELRDLVVSGFGQNGINVDDGGTGVPSHHVTVRRVQVRGTSPNGNYDGLKLSGVDDLVVLDSLVERWGVWGSGVDLVGCHRVLIGGCMFQHGGFNGVQAKGGSSGVRVVRCRFADAGTRAVQAGGFTEPEYFRPQLTAQKAGERAEVRRMTVEGNVIVGGEAAVACCTAAEVVVRLNTVYVPGKWFLRILQETADPTFVACRDGLVSDNLVVFRSTGWASGGINVGGGTAPQTFRFARNAWYCENLPALSAPGLPTPEAEGVIGANPRFVNAAAGDLRPRDRGLTVGKGYTVYERDW